MTKTSSNRISYLGGNNSIKMALAKLTRKSRPQPGFAPTSLVQFELTLRKHALERAGVRPSNLIVFLEFDFPHAQTRVRDPHRFEVPCRVHSKYVPRRCGLRVSIHYLERRWLEQSREAPRAIACRGLWQPRQPRDSGQLVFCNLQIIRWSCCYDPLLQHHYFQ